MVSVPLNRVMTTLLSKGEGLIDQQYDGSDDTFQNVFGAAWFGQTFTPTLSHQITTVRLLLTKEGSPGICTVSVRATSGGKPTGADLASGTRDLDVLNIATTASWIDFDLGAGAALTTAVVYALVVRTAGGDTSNDGKWRTDDSSPSYAGGSRQQSADSGSSWGAPTTSEDCMFKEGTQ